MSFDQTDYHYMQQALQLAAAATRRAAPNPGVGCVLVRDGHVLGQGATLQAGADHAEIQAIKDCLANGQSPAGATAYVTLEPCSHVGRTPPCADVLIQHRLARVVAAMIDPFPAVSGRGMARLQAAGILTETGLLAAQAQAVHRGFLSRVCRGRPWVLLKGAASLDGKTALLNGESQWITSAAARQDVHRLRASHCAILTGSGTVLADDPQLTVRDVACLRQPLRVVLDSGLRTAPTCKIYQGGNTLLATCLDDPARLAPYQQAGAEILQLPGKDGHADVAALLDALGQRGINSLMVEAGQDLNGAMLRTGLVDEMVLYMAPILLGDAARGLFAWPALESMADKISLSLSDVRQIGPDLRLVLGVTAGNSPGTG